MSQKARKWEFKDKEETQYRTGMGRCDYNIPMFGYRSALLICLCLFGSLFFGSFIGNTLGMDDRWFMVILGGLGCGFSVAYTQFFMERRKGICLNFWIVGILMSMVGASIIFLMYFAGMVM